MEKGTMMTESDLEGCKWNGCELAGNRSVGIGDEWQEDDDKIYLYFSGFTENVEIHLNYNNNNKTVYQNAYIIVWEMDTEIKISGDMIITNVGPFYRVTYLRYLLY